MKTFTDTLDEAQVSLLERLADSLGPDVTVEVIVQAFVESSIQMGAMCWTNPDLFDGTGFRDIAIVQGTKMFARLRGKNA